MPLKMMQSNSSVSDQITFKGYESVEDFVERQPLVEE